MELMTSPLSEGHFGELNGLKLVRQLSAPDQVHLFLQVCLRRRSQDSCLEEAGLGLRSWQVGVCTYTCAHAYVSVYPCVGVYPCAAYVSGKDKQLCIWVTGEQRLGRGPEPQGAGKAGGSQRGALMMRLRNLSLV